MNSGGGSGGRRVTLHERSQKPPRRSDHSRQTTSAEWTASRSKWETERRGWGAQGAPREPGGLSGVKETAAPLFGLPSPRQGGGNPTWGAGLPAGSPRRGPGDAARSLGLQHGGQRGGVSGGAAGGAPACLPAPRAHARCPASRDARLGPAHRARLGGTTLGPTN